MKPSDGAALKTTLTAVVLYGVFVVGLPALILRSVEGVLLPSKDIGILRWLGVPVAGFGFYLYVWAAILLAEAVFFSSAALLAYALAYWLWLTLFVVLKEEPDLRRTFGEAFDDYCRDVPRWMPRPWRSSRLAGSR